VFFGLVATVGTSYAATGVFDAWAFLPASAVGVLATQLLVVNNLRDIPTDGPSGKRTLAVRMGDRATRILYLALTINFFLIVVVCGVAERWSLIAMLAVVAAWKPGREVLRGAAGKDLIPVLGGTARFQMVAGALLTIGIALS
jgi:1,4-dihydroxy-2-naphthoate octaprenyltransferase